MCAMSGLLRPRPGRAYKEPELESWGGGRREHRGAVQAHVSPLGVDSRQPLNRPTSGRSSQPQGGARHAGRYRCRAFAGRRTRGMAAATVPCASGSFRPRQRRGGKLARAAARSNEARTPAPWAPLPQALWRWPGRGRARSWEPGARRPPERAWGHRRCVARGARAARRCASAASFPAAPATAEPAQAEAPGTARARLAERARPRRGRPLRSPTRKRRALGGLWAHGAAAAPAPPRRHSGRTAAPPRAPWGAL
mmetsp:Transcript_113659/g.316260  ORF Transcript_113659/g.316260 Transcript_113659/m.316260 type:complete len:253 (-) Transcript_113659:481-1239(-)